MKHVFFQWKLPLLCLYILHFSVPSIKGQPTGDYRLVYEDEFNDGVVTWGADDCVTHGANHCEESMFYMSKNVKGYCKTSRDMIRRGMLNPIPIDNV